MKICRWTDWHKIPHSKEQFAMFSIEFKLGYLKYKNKISN